MAHSSVEAEFQSMPQGFCELLLQWTLLYELGYDMFCNNKVAISISLKKKLFQE